MNRDCQICKRDVPIQSHHTVSDGKVWHFECRKAQQKMDEYYAKWQDCLNRLKGEEEMQRERELYGRRD